MALDDAMFDRPPNERETLSWLLVTTWFGLILITVPLVRYGTDYVNAVFGRAAFSYGVSLLLIIAAGVTLRYLIRRGGMTVTRFLSLGAITAFVVFLTFGLPSDSTAEAIHFLEYGILSLLIYRAFAHRVHDVSIYPAVILLGTLFGTIEETVQWLVPGRVFDLRDIWLNFTAVTLLQLAIATAIRPGAISKTLKPQSVRRLCRLSALLLAGLGLCHLNTPKAIAVYTTHFPVLAFIWHAEDVMVEYGHYYEAPNTGAFRSRFTVEELHRLSSSRADEAENAFGAFETHEDYVSFLKEHTALKDPFFHEAAVHLFSRNINLARARKSTTPDKQQLRYTVAHRENAILEGYFGPILRSSGSLWPPKTKLEVHENNDPGRQYESSVSRRLITSFSHRQALWFSTIGVIILLGLGQLVRTAKTA